MASQQFAKLYSSKKRVVGSSPTSSALPMAGCAELAKAPVLKTGARFTGL